MNPDANGATEPRIEWYARSAVDEFVASAAEQRSTLEAAIAAANERTEQAQASLGLHRLMAAMLLQAQRELGDLRRKAEHEAAELMAAAEREVEALVGHPGIGAVVTASPAPPPTPVDVSAGANGTAAAAVNGTDPAAVSNPDLGPVIDLSAASPDAHDVPPPHEVPPPDVALAPGVALAPPDVGLDPPSYRTTKTEDDGESNSEFFAYLREGLSDPKPFGTRNGLAP